MSSATRTQPLVAGRYQLRAGVGTGGMAAVYRATDLTLDRTVAVKLLHAHLAVDDHAQQRFESEARYAAGLAHPNLVTIFDFGID